ncbi:glycosyltransferase WbuB [Erythrobacter sp. HI0019]|uniref:glycosyltransferase family 4 protein n=1 Tax=unclassified Erythrobacter TaxID=2633097 RepID=UPI0007B81C2A|nr:MULTISPECIES: glycosyltransferase family 4 protein [unclassified Erythrobacter]KZX91537.1 glycosyltransferase WbuB [Erythrobacter sp. HI0019]KZY10158.1 glycosyltransferase WbuB [Erythrobacter sp. HI0028]
MKIWIIVQYAALPTTGIGTRHRHLARELAALGHDVSIVSARWSHLTRDTAAADAAPRVEEFEGFRFVNLNLLRYRHAHDKKRVLNWFLFAFKVLKTRRLLDEIPDVIIYSSPSLVGFLSAEWLARLYRARLIFEVRDIWPLTLKQIGGFSSRHPAIRLLQWIEDRAYSKSERVISNLRGAVDHMVTRGLDRDRFIWIPNGVSFNTTDGVESAPDPVLAQIPEGKFVVGYAGTLGSANSIDTLLGAARILRDRSEIVFALLGDGKDRTALEGKVQLEGLTNVIFLGPVPKAQVAKIIERFDACWIGWKAIPLYDYGIAANKLFDYFSSSRPVLHSYSGKHDPVSTYDAGITVPALDSDALARAITDLIACPAERRHEMGQNGRRAVFEDYDYSKLAKKLEGVLISMRKD